MSHSVIAVFAASAQEAHELVKRRMPCDDFTMEETHDEVFPSAFITQDANIISQDRLAWSVPLSDANVQHLYERLFLAAQEEARTHGLTRFLAYCHS
ncbi:hypothetical protein [uncultured Selenomonas sp.]|uniref:hypothetical protein n=1 Tax=uncultured Selenomonas sp. TaxID=159275 RepID=UPI0025E26699|nr:hypothetical protein [uncultured Selenomonas sp.]